jgi:hypothetical protein
MPNRLFSCHFRNCFPRATLLATLLCLLWAGAGFADGGSITGFVTAADSGEPLAWANVSLLGTNRGTTSNAQGSYALTDLPPGAHRVRFSFIGYQPLQRRVALEVEARRRVDVALEPAPIELAGVVAVADRAEEERALQSGFVALESQQFRQLPAMGETDILRALQLLPGIQAASDLSSGLYIRGGGPDQTLILLDGIPLYNPAHAFGFFSTFNADAIRDMSLHKGAYPANYGGRLGAVLDVANKDGNRNHFAASGGVSVIAARTTLEGPVGNGSWILSGRRTYLDPVLAAMRRAGSDVPDYYFYDLNLRVNQDFGRRDRFALSGYFGNDRMDFALTGDTSFMLEWGNRALSGKWTHIFAPQLFANFLLSWSRYRTLTAARIFETPLRFESVISDLSLKADLDFFPSPDHTVNAGAALTRYGFDYGQEFNYESQLDVALTPIEVALYAQDSWRLSALTSARFGLRTAYFSAGERRQIEPRLALTHALTAELRAKLAAGVYHQHLQLVATEGFNGGDTWIPLDETVEPGRSIQVAGGLAWDPQPTWNLTADLYYSDLRNLVTIDTRVASDNADDENTADEIFISGGTGYAAGLELFAQKRLGALTGWFGYGLGWTRRRFAEINQGKEFPPKYDRRHDLSLVLTWRHGSWTLGLNQVYATGQAFTPAAARYSLRSPALGSEPIDDPLLPAAKNSMRLFPYHRMDLSAKRRFRPWGLDLECYLQVFNAYNRHNEWFVQYEAKEEAVSAEVVHMLPILPTIGINYAF